jgi:hypothetical protein
VTDVHIENLTVTRAFAENFGAGIYFTQNAAGTIVDCEITACGDGGIICTFFANVDISQCLVTDNGSKQGGGFAIESGSTATLTECTVTGNFAPAGGGVFIRAANVTIDRCIISNNFLDTTEGSGGGVEVRDSQVVIRDSEINDNDSTGPGGGITVRDFSNTTIERTLIQGNETTDDGGTGGGVFIELADIALVDCTITRNSAPGALADGGGIYAKLAQTMTVRGCTIAANGTNEPNGLGGGIALRDSSPTISRTILAFNSPGKGLYCENAPSMPVISCCDIFGNQDGDEICGVDAGDNFSLNPLFCNLAENDYTLHVDSPCLDNQHPQGAHCEQIGAQGLGTCDGIGISEDGLASGVVPPMRLFASPNPFAYDTTIHFGLRQPGAVWLAIHDVSGRRIRLLEDRTLGAGEHKVAWDGKDDAGRPVPSGVYIYKLGGIAPLRSGRLVLAR